MILCSLPRPYLDICILVSVADQWLCRGNELDEDIKQRYTTQLAVVIAIQCNVSSRFNLITLLSCGCHCRLLHDYHPAARVLIDGVVL